MAGFPPLSARNSNASLTTRELPSSRIVKGLSTRVYVPLKKATLTLRARGPWTSLSCLLPPAEQLAEWVHLCTSP